MVIYAISDLEGFHPRELIPEYHKVIEETYVNEVIICGDVLDSTMISKSDPLLTSRKSNNLRTIFEILKKPNLKLTFGNRDLNKLKVGPLTILKTKDNTPNELVNKFNKGELPLNLSTYHELKVGNNLEWVQKMSNWYPFWGGINETNIKYWQDDNEPTVKDEKGNIIREYGFFEKRFLKIFGADTKIGTMSDDNLLVTIPTELNLYNKDNNDFNAFIVLAVFKSMLLDADINLPNDFSGLIFPTEHLNQSKFKGFLYKMYTDDKNDMIIHKCVCGMLNNICKCKKGLCNCEENKNMYLFSHGGVSSDIIENNTIDEISKVLYNDGVSKSLKEKLRDANKVLKVLNGGYYNTQTVTNKSSKDIEEKINLFNKNMKTHIKRILQEDYYTQFKGPSNSMLLLLIASATFECNSYFTKIGATGNCDDMNILKTSSDLTSTMAGIKNLRKKKTMFFKNGNIYNIFGHVPNGFFPTIDLFENGKNKTYLINIDTSNTFFSTSANIKTNITGSYLKINGNKISINSNISIKAEENEILVDNDPIKYLSTKIIDDTYDKKIIAFSNDTIKNQFLIKSSTNEFNIILDLEIGKDIDIDNIKKIGVNEQIFYHGLVINKNKFVVLTYNRPAKPPSFPRCLVILSEEDFKKIDFSQKGGNYLNKYLKYKQKYIYLKNNIGL
jgi:hypothetical protein